MAKLESAWKKFMVDEIMANGGYATRMEDQYRVGLPDCLFSMPSTGLILAEVKRFDGLFFAASPRQWVEIQRIRKGGGTVCLIGVNLNTNKIHIAQRGDEERALADHCYTQHDGELFCQLLQRWYGTQHVKR